MRDISQQEYWKEISSIAKDVTDEAREAIKSDDITPDGAREWAHDRLHEWIDGHQWVIYTAYNWDVLRHSPNDEYIFAEGLAPKTVEAWSDITTPATYYAMVQDVGEHSDWGVDDLEDEFEDDEEDVG